MKVRYDIAKEDPKSFRELKDIFFGGDEGPNAGYAEAFRAKKEELAHQAPGGQEKIAA